MHSTTKFLGGHSDLLGGVLVVNNLKVAEEVRTIPFIHSLPFHPYTLASYDAIAHPLEALWAAWKPGFCSVA